MPPAYVAAWVALFSVSSIHWFLPAGGSGLGLQNIHDRADAIGAAYAFDPASGHPRHVVEVRVAD